MPDTDSVKTRRKRRRIHRTQVVYVGSAGDTQPSSKTDIAQVLTIQGHSKQGRLNFMNQRAQVEVAVVPQALHYDPANTAPFDPLPGYVRFDTRDGHDNDYDTDPRHLFDHGYHALLPGLDADGQTEASSPDSPDSEEEGDHGEIVTVVCEPKRKVSTLDLRATSRT